ncbi:calcium/proton exchanger [Clostridium sp. CM028]|uniref:calcium/proton exchanger n=1 Tax=Clostridium TaxID=1485 RepID=UPI0013EEB923|nr:MULTISPECIES: calcium/proton exchanger [Clostridium]MBU3090793.1 calcium/proton exchanger [Clostridium sp. CF011]MBW9144642.1 calcium/proton exchanger [Clostridium sp. CM027]MBW9147832.1 calcium/proton exchanger [Clostridium sp. CM028]MBZ9609144.1 calcium/proton exchanger [Clostridium estertheticum]UVE40603.1 calcium/proton exchanger [Clostridium sp. CM027]
MKKTYIFIIGVIALMFISTSSSLINTIIYSIAIVPLAILLGDQTTSISDYIGQKKGGLLAATVGNVPELMMGIWSIKYGMIPMVQASLIGSIVNNMLLGLGIAVVFGGFKFRQQNFNRIIARTNFNMLLLALSSMVVIATLNRYSVVKDSVLISISVKVAFLLIGIYILGLIFSLYTHNNLFVVSVDKEEKKVVVNKKVIESVMILICISVLLYFISDKLIYNIREFTKNYNISQEFIGIILIPLLGNIGENVSTIMCAMQNKVDMSLETAIGSSIQISLFVTPVLVIFSCFMGLNMTLLFPTFHIIMCSIAVGMSFLVFQDGKTYWLEGSILITTYIIITLAYYYIV